MKKIFFIFIILSVSKLLFSQQKYNISGFITDSLSGEAIIGAHIYDNNKNKGTITNSFGYYTLNFYADSETELIISFVGHASKTFKYKANKNIIKNIQLSSNNKLTVVSVTASNNIKKNEVGIINLNIKEIKEIPSLFGEVDVIKAFEYLPGVQTGGEGKSSLNVRGGSSDQNLIILDDVPLYYVNHFSGLYSVFNSDAIKNVKLIKGGFPARYGGRLSSILDIRMQEGNMKKISSSASIGVLSTKLMLEAPIKKNKSSFLFSLRGNPIPVLAIFDLGLNYHFYDINFKTNIILSNKDRLFFSSYMGNDFLIMNNKTEFIKKSNTSKWGNKMVAIRWNHLFGKKIFSNTIISFSEYKYSTNQKKILTINSTTQKTYNNTYSLVQDYSIQTNFEFYPTSKLNVKLGANTIFHNFMPGNNTLYQEQAKIVLVDTTFSNNKIISLDNAIYCETEYKLFKWLNFVVGLRYTNYIIKTNSYNHIEPRFLINFILNNNTSIKFTYTKMQQYVHLLSYSGTGLPSDYWLPATKIARPEKSEQFSIAFNQNLFNKKMELSLEGYYKKMYNLIAFKSGSSFSALENWENIIETGGIGTAKGIELLLSKKSGKTTGWISTTYSFTDRKFENLNRGKAFPSKYDRRFDFDIVLIHHFNERISATTTWTYGSGYPITLPLVKYNTSNLDPYSVDIFTYDKINSYRMQAYHRLDFSFNYAWNYKKTKHTLNLSVYNVYNKQNPYYYYFERETEVGASLTNGTIPLITKDLKLYQQSLFPIIPSISYSFKF